MNLSETMDHFLDRRTSWNGSIVRDETEGSPTWGRYFRVAHSFRDPASGAWEIRWNLSDEVTWLPQGEGVFRFDGSTWDLPAVASTVVPKRRWATYGSIAAVLSLFVVVAPIHDKGFVLGMLWILTLAACAMSWLIEYEPVLGNKVLYATNAALTIHNARMKQAEIQRLEHQRAHPTLMQQVIENYDNVARQQAALNRESHDRAQILANQRALAERLGITLPAQH